MPGQNALVSRSSGTMTFLSLSTRHEMLRSPICGVCPTLHDGDACFFKQTRHKSHASSQKECEITGRLNECRSCSDRVPMVGDEDIAATIRPQVNSVEAKSFKAQGSSDH